MKWESWQLSFVILCNSVAFRAHQGVSFLLDLDCCFIGQLRGQSIATASIMAAYHTDPLWEILIQEVRQFPVLLLGSTLFVNLFNRSCWGSQESSILFINMLACEPTSQMCVCLCPLSRWDDKTGLKCPLLPFGFMLGRLVVTLITQSQKKSQVDLTGRLCSLAPKTTMPSCPHWSLMAFNRRECGSFLLPWQESMPPEPFHLSLRSLTGGSMHWQAQVTPSVVFDVKVFLLTGQGPENRSLSLPACCGVSAPRLAAPDKSALI